MTATLELPKDLAISVLRKAGTGDNLLSALDAIVSYENKEVVEETTEPVEWVNAVVLEDEDDGEANVVAEEFINL
jgi:hypothetical protein